MSCRYYFPLILGVLLSVWKAIHPKPCPGAELHFFYFFLEETNSRMTALIPKSFKFKLKPGDWQHATPFAGSLSITRGGLCRDSSFLLYKCKNQSQFERRLMAKQKSEWKWRKTKVTAIRLHRWDEHRHQVLDRCFMPMEWLRDMPYSIQP